MPKWVVKKRHIGAAVAAAARPLGRPRIRVQRAARMTDEQLHRLLWHDDYWPIIDHMLQQQPELVQVLTDWLRTNRSRYQPGIDSLLVYLKKERISMANIVQIMLSIGRKKTGCTPLKVIKTISALKQKVPYATMQAEVKLKTMLTLNTARQRLKDMKALRPPPKFAVSNKIIELVVDQLHMFRGCRKRRTHRAVERVGEDGTKLMVEKVCILQMIDYPVDNAWFTQQDLYDIANHGVYTEYADIMFTNDVFDFDATRGKMFDLMDEHALMLHDACGGDPLKLHDNIFVLMARPDYDPNGPTYSNVLTPITHCDTNNYRDMQRKTNRMFGDYPDAIAFLEHSDAQTIINTINTQKKRPQRLDHIIPVPGNLHAAGNIGTYAGHHMYYECYIEAAAEAVKFEKIEEKPHNLEGDKLNNHQYFNCALSLATKYMLIKRHGFTTVCNSRRLEQVCALTYADTVMFHFLLEQGEPCMGWIRASRSNRATLYDHLWGWSFQLARANHNTNYQQVCVARAHTRYCLHKSLRTYMYHHQTVSRSGRIGCDWEKDSDMEFLNKETECYSGKYAHSHVCLFSMFVYVDFCAVFGF